MEKAYELAKKKIVKIIDDNTLYADNLLACSYEELAEKIINKLKKDRLLKLKEEMNKNARLL
jgi:hypothetical protein